MRAGRVHSCWSRAITTWVLPRCRWRSTSVTSLAYRETALLQVSRASVKKAFSHLVLSDGVLDQVGPAVAAGHSMFVYGPPGNGKTVIAQAIRNLLDGEIAVPHAIEVEGSIIRVFDPVNHEPIKEPQTSPP